MTFHLTRENVMFLTFLRVDLVLYEFDPVLCDFNNFLVLFLFLHVLWVLTRKIVTRKIVIFYELNRIFNNNDSTVKVSIFTYRQDSF